MNDRTMFKVSNEDVWQGFHEAEVLVSHRDLLPDIIWSELGFTAWMFPML